MTLDNTTLGLPLSTLFAFLLVLARVAGLVAFLPIPAWRAAPQAVRAMLAITVTFALFPVWPNLPNALPGISDLAIMAIAETGFGLVMGLAVNLLTEGFQIAAQLIGVQAGYGYATTIDPNSQADAGLLQVLTGLLSGLLVFALGIDRELLRILAASFQRFPAGSLAQNALSQPVFAPYAFSQQWTLSAASADGILRLGAGMFSLGLRMALPIVALLALIDLSLALLGRMQQQLQMLSLTFPLKMLAALLLLAALMPAFVRGFEGASRNTMTELWKVASAGH